MPKRPSRDEKPSRPPPPPAPTPTAPAGSAATAKKTAATVLRHKQERRDESLRQIQSQTDEGSLVIRHMSDDEHAAASELAREARTRNEVRARRYRDPEGK